MKYIQFDAVPDSGHVTISRSNATALHNHYSLRGTLPVLMQNYPNPFNPTTMIHFKLVKRGHATLKVYDIRGRELITLVK